VLSPPSCAGGRGGEGQLVAVEGIDASGKSTVAHEVVSRIAETGRRAMLLDRRSATALVAGYLAEHLGGLRSLIWDYPQAARTSQLGFEHWRHLLVAWFHAIDHVAVRPALADGALVVADSWFYKYVARFALTCGLAGAERSFCGVSVPVAVAWLDADPAVCVRRRANARATESGEWLGLDGSERAFVTYQRRIREVYIRLAARHDWSRIDPEDLDTTVDRVCSRVLEGRGRPRDHGT
jgi:dTMP kinase